MPANPSQRKIGSLVYNTKFLMIPGSLASYHHISSMRPESSGIRHQAYFSCQSNPECQRRPSLASIHSELFDAISRCSRWCATWAGALQLMTNISRQRATRNPPKKHNLITDGDRMFPKQTHINDLEHCQGSLACGSTSHGCSTSHRPAGSVELPSWALANIPEAGWHIWHGHHRGRALASKLQESHWGCLMLDTNERNLSEWQSDRSKTPRFDMTPWKLGAIICISACRGIRLQ